MTIFIKENLQYLRKQRGLSVLALAKELEVNDTLIGKIESGVTIAPQITTIIKICNYFDISLDSLVYDDLKSKKN